LISKFDMEKGKERGKINIGTEEKPYWAYYEDTNEKNYTRVITPVKRHNRNRFSQAIKHQLLYFKGVKYHHTYEGRDYHSDIPFQAKVLHNTENLIVSNTRQFSKPHIIVVKEPGSSFGVTYGTVDFEELEMENLQGSVGFKCPLRSVDRDPETGEEIVLQEGITVTPSRESVVWDKHTRDYIQKIIQNAQVEASKLIEKELNETDFILWLQKANKVIANASQTSYFYRQSEDALGELAKIIDKTKLSVTFSKNRKIRFYQSASKFFWGFNLRTVILKQGKWDRNLGGYKKQIERDPIQYWNQFSPETIYLLKEDERASAVKDRYLNQLHDTYPLLLKFPNKADLIEEAKESHKDWEDKKIRDWVDKRLEIRDEIWEEIKASKSFKIQNYSDIEVPEDFEKKIEEEETKAKLVTMSPAEKRALQGKIVCYTYSYRTESYGRAVYRLSKREPVLGSLDDIEVPVIYGTQKDDDKLLMLALMNHNKKQAYSLYPDYFPLDRSDEKKNVTGSEYDEFTLARFSKRNIKHIKKNPNFINVNDYLWTMEEKSFHIGSFFVPYFTSRYIESRLQKLNYLTNFKDFNEVLSKAYNFLTNYTNKNYNSYLRSSLQKNDQYQKLCTLADNALEIQLYLRKNKDNIDKDKLKEKGKELLKNENIEKATVIDENILNLLEELEVYSENIKDLFNNVSFLTRKDASIPDNASRLVDQIIQNEGLDEYTLTDNTLNTLEKN